MRIGEQITQLATALHQEAAGALSLQRIERMQALTRQLDEVLSQTGQALRGGTALVGDLWEGPGDEDEDLNDEEETDMDREQLLMLMEEIDKAGIVSGAKRDAIRRAEQ